MGSIGNDQEQAYLDAQAILEQMANLESNAKARPTPKTSPPVETNHHPTNIRRTTLQWSVELLMQLIDSLPDALIIIDRQGNIVHWNHNVELLFHYSPAELSGAPVELLVPEYLREQHIELRNTFFAHPYSRPIGEGKELLGQRKDGEFIPVEISISPLSTPEGIYGIGIIRDVSQQRREQARLKTLVEQIPAVTFTAPLDDSAGELYVSPHIEEMLGFTQEEWLGDPILWYRQLHPDDRHYWNNQFAPTCAQGDHFREIYRFIAKDGRIVWVQGDAKLVRDELGHPLFLQGLAYDITHIKEAELTHQRLAAIVSSSEDAIISKTIDGIILSWNQGAEKIYGYTAEEIVGQSIRTIFPDDRFEEFNTIKQKISQGNSVRHLETKRVRKDGVHIDVSLTISPIYDSEGRLTGASTIARDVTRRKQAEENLQEQAQLNALEAAVGTVVTQVSTLQEMLQACTDTLVHQLTIAFARIWIVEEATQTLVLQASSGMYTHLDGAHGRIPVGQFKIGRIAEEQQPHCTNNVAEDPRVSNQEWAKQEGMRGFAGFPLIIEDKTVGVLGMFSKQEFSQGVLHALELISSTISLGIKRKQAEEELERRVEERTEELARSMEELSEKKEELEQFAHVSAHDFNEPLRSIVNYPQKIAKTYGNQLDEQGRKWLDRTLAGVARMRRLIEDVREYSKVLRRQRTFEDIDCNELFTTVCANLEAAITESEATVTLDSLPIVKGFYTDLLLLFQNLVGNALKYRDPTRKPEIHVGRTTHDEYDCVIFIRDNGIGMDQKYWKRIFELGERLHSSAQYEGSGFGLAICDKIVRAHQGEIWAESVLDQGSTFYCALPCGSTKSQHR